MVDRRFFVNGHTIHLGVEPTTSGWDVREECDSALVHVEHHDDWHRVERAMDLLELKANSHDVHADTPHR